jgi:hypothetical protein
MMDAIKQKYFSDPGKTVSLKRKEFLIRKGEINHRLYLVESGKLDGFDPNDKGAHFKAEAGDYVGVYSFFAPSAVVQMSIVALEDSVVRYFEKDIFSLGGEEGKAITYDFMPTVMQLLAERQKQIQEANRERRHVLKEMKEIDRLTSLGQLSAGVAHELNNAITVIARGSEQVSEDVLQYLKCNPLEREMIQLGLEKGRVVSSSEARTAARVLRKKSSFTEEQLRDYARTGMGERLAQKTGEAAQRAYELWNLGATLHDLQIAGRQAEHVVVSMKTLAATHVVRQRGCDVNESIQKALSLLMNAVKNIPLALELNQVPTIYGNSGELVQVWTNIIRNAIDAMEDIPRDKAKLLIRTELAAGKIQVTIKDHGPGIPANMIGEIFKPQVTTKNKGQRFGLGLGLTIVQKIIKQYAGDISVESTPKGTKFIITIPIGESS